MTDFHTRLALRAFLDVRHFDGSKMPGKTELDLGTAASMGRTHARKPSAVNVRPALWYASGEPKSLRVTISPTCVQVGNPMGMSPASGNQRADCRELEKPPRETAAVMLLAPSLLRPTPPPMTRSSPVGEPACSPRLPVLPPACGILNLKFKVVSGAIPIQDLHRRGRSSQISPNREDA